MQDLAVRHPAKFDEITERFADIPFMRETQAGIIRDITGRAMHRRHAVGQEEHRDRARPRARASAMGERGAASCTPT